MSQVLQVNGDYLVKVSDGGTITLDTGTRVGDVIITGNLVVDNDLTINGNLILGNEGSDIVLVLGEISSDLKPKVSNIYDLGSESKTWRSLYVNQIQNPQGVVTIKNLVEPSESQDAATKNYVDTLLGRVDNVYYVSKSGDDLNDGKTLGKSKLTIKAAVEAATLDIANGYDCTVFVKSGDYEEDNPIRLPEKLSIWGDTLRSTTVRPLNKKLDLFWVTNGNYLAQMTFKDHEAPAAAVAFAPPTEEFPAVAIHTSPYVQNCTSITTTGCGMRVDGAYVTGLKSMVVDAFTQYNQGGIGIHMLNRGNTQLVSAFTINCDIAFLCTSGGFCSLTNSNSSFGNFGLVADGVSEALYSGTLTGNPLGIFGDEITLNNLIIRPNVGDAVSINGSNNYYTVSIASELTAGEIAKAEPNFTVQPVQYRTARQLIRTEKDKISIDTIDYINETYPDLNYNQFKCTRDTLLIVDAAVDDAVLGTNYKSIQAGMSYSRLSASVVRDEQLAESTDALLFTKGKTLELIEGDGSPSQEYLDIENNFDLIYSLFSEASAETPPTPPNYIFTPPIGAAQEKINARDIILANRDFLIQEGIAYIQQLTPIFNYDRDRCQRDVGLIVDALGYDLMFGSNFRSITAGRSYYRANASEVLGSQKKETISALETLREVVAGLVSDNEAAVTSVNNNMDIIIDIFDQGLSAVPEYVTPTPVGLDQGIIDARDLIEANREFIKAEIVKYIDVNYGSLIYNEDKCVRDIGYILDAVYYDMTYSGNMETAIAANSYFLNAVTVIPGEEQATIDSYTYMKTLVENVSRDIPVIPLQVDEPQVSGTAGSLQGATQAGALIQDVITVIDTETLITSPTPADTAWVSLMLVDSFNQLQAEIENIKLAVIDFVDSNYYLLTYDTEKCKRDIGYIIDALGYDIMFDSNFRSIIAARSYYRINASAVLSSQRSAMIGSLRRLKDIIKGIAGENAVAIQRIEEKIELMVDIINRGLEVIPSYEIPNPTSGFDTGYINARTLIDSNREFIKAEVIKYIEVNYPDVYNTFDQTTCSRDIDYILDAVYYDITYDTNAESLVAGRSYYAGTVVQVGPGELAATLASYGYMKTITGQIAVNSDVSQLQNTVPQVFGSAGSLSASADIEALIQDIIDYIDEPTSLPVLRSANTGWVDQSLVTLNLDLQESKELIKEQIQSFIDTKYSYNQATCARDIGYVLDAMVYDQLYGGNSQTFAAVQSYYSAEMFQISSREKLSTADTFNFLKTVTGSCLLNNLVTPLQTEVLQNTSLPSASAAEVATSDQLFDIITEVLENGFTSTILLNENIPDFDPQFPGVDVTFHQYSLITASGHTFEWVGSGINVNTSLPYLGGQPISENKAVETNGGKVYWTGTDQFGDFNIGGELIIKRDSGTIEGRTFTKSLFAVLTPYILAVGE
jgi:hypothetical protein